MAKDAASKTIGLLNGIPFDNIIGAPLSAAVDAQAKAAVSTVNFIESVGMRNGKGDTKEAVYVVFSYVQNGRRANISVPLLTIVPIPYIAINNINLDFKVAVNATDETTLEDVYSEQKDENSSSSSKKGGGWLTTKKVSKMSTSLSTKRDSKSTQDSKFSVEATIDVHIQAGQESLPSGMAKILGMLSEAVSVVPEKGELTVDGPYEQGTDRYIIIMYKNPYGLFSTEQIHCSAGAIDNNYHGDGVKYVFGKDTKEADVVAYGYKVNDNNEEVVDQSNVLLTRKLKF